jgi:hypothetical protein
MQPIRAGLAGLLSALVAVPVAAAANVTVRVEGGTGTLLARTSVPASGADVTKDGGTCSGATAAGALDRGVAGDWDGTNFGGSLGVSVDRIRTESLPFDSGKYWNFDHNGTSSQSGVCGYTLQPDDEILFYAACYTATSGCFSGNPLSLSAPATVTAGEPFTVRVQEYDDTEDPSPLSPAGGATVSGGGAGVQTTPVSGTAEMTLSQTGPVLLTATKGSQVRDEQVVTVTAPPVYSIPTPTPTPTATQTATPDTTAPVSHILRIHEGQVFKHRGKAPRTLRASVSEADGLAKVTLGLTRRVGKRCSRFSDTRARFVKVRCGRHPRFTVGSAPQVSYLLPQRLRRGAYVLDVISTDRAGNVETLKRGLNRVVFTVR